MGTQINNTTAISIHALLAESDDDFPVEYPVDEISIHALLAESDTIIWPEDEGSCLFQSTLSLRRATSVGESMASIQSISIHALLAESD